MGRQKKNEITVQEIDPPFVDDHNKDYVNVLKVTKQEIGGEEKYFYVTQIDCARLVERIITDDDLYYYIVDANPFEYHLYFKFVKDSLLGSIIIYVYDKGVYNIVTENEFKGFLKNYIPSNVRKSKDIDEVYKLLLMENSFYLENNNMNADYNYINFKNGLLNLNTMELEEHTPEKFFTVQIPVNYKPLDDCEKGMIFDKYLDELVSGDNDTKKVILEAMGLVISNIPGYLTKKCILMVGPKDCGKTQIKKLLTELIGIRYTSSMDLDKMNNSQFGTSELYNKRLAGSNDMRYNAVSDMGIFKQLTGGDAISIEFKGRGAFSYIYTGFIWFLANDFPMFSGKKGREIYERFLVIPCNHVVKKSEQDPELVNKMLKESEYIVALCVEHLKDLINRHYKFIESKRIKDAIEKYELANNSLLQFVTEYCEIDNDLDISERLNFSKFKRNYQAWCRDSGIKPMKVGKDEIEYYLGDRYGTKVLKSGTNYLSNIVMNEMFKQEYISYSD